MDPIHGDDDSAWELNPGNPLDATYPEPSLDGYCRWPSEHRSRPLDRRDEVDSNNMPYQGSNPNYGATGYLQHAPYSFRCLTGPHGAVEYVYRLFDDPNAFAPALPWQNPTTMMSVTHVVIHCLPGLYGPRNPLLLPHQPDIDPLTGLPWNGERFPVQLGGRPEEMFRFGLFERVSIQGTSALDTIFDGRGKDTTLPAYLRSTNIFEVRSRPNNSGVPGTDHDESFIDGITIRNAASLEGVATGQGIGIRMMGVGRVEMTVTNCFFVNNVVGIALDAFGIQDGAAQRWGGHEPRIVNNTFVGNQVSIWSGEVDQDSPPPTQPYVSNTHNPLVINNVLRGSVSGFEGLQAGTLAVVIVDGVALPTPLDFNAWIPSQTNLGFVPGASLWSTASTGFSTPPNLSSVTPRVDLTSVHNLFVRDLLAAAVGLDDDHDFRLSPSVSDDPKIPPGQMNPLVANPLIGAGVSRATPGTGGIGIANSLGASFAAAPGLPSGAEEAPVHGWDYDCEGFGNIRLLPRSGVMPSPLPQYGTVDIGADQCADLIMAGYLPSTRMYVREVKGSGASPFDRAFFVDEPNQVGLSRPLASWLLGGLPWYDNVQAAPSTQNVPCPGGPTETYYTQGFSIGAQQTARSLLYFLAAIGPFPKNLVCDFSPSLQSDVHPFWGQRFADYPVGGAWPLTDPYACNPIFHSWWDISAAPIGADFFPDNPALFYNRSYTAPHGGAVWQMDEQTNTWVWDSHLNPPGTLFLAGGPLNWLFLPSSPFGPFAGACGQPAVDTGVWGLNSACPDVLPALQLDLGVRINCNRLTSGSSIRNLQTFLVLMNGDTSAQSGNSAASQSSATLRVGPETRLSQLLNLPAQLGTEADFELYQQVMRRVPGVVR